MASLQSSGTLLSNPNHRIPSSLSSKPSHLLFNNARRSHRFKVSCNGGDEQKPSSEGRVDRRNMLLGFGGLYGAANLISNPKAAYADPLQPPEFKACGVAHVGDDLLDINCCPPISNEIIDYKLPPVRVVKKRSAAHRLSLENLFKYEMAISMMRRLDVTDPDDPRGFTQQARIHCAYCNGAHDQVGYPDNDIQIHFSWLFYPFHRWYLYFYERIMAELIGDPTFALPFWNWDHPKGMPFPKIFDNEYSPLFNKNRNPEHRHPAIVGLNRSDNSEDDLQKIANNLAVMYNEMIRNVNVTTDFMGQSYKAGDLPPGTGRGGTVELGSHTGVHVWVGNPVNKYREDMGNFYSAGWDTAFYSHHANVDRMWTIWNKLPTDVPKQINDPDYLNASFLFYDEKKNLVRVKVADCLDHTKMGYDYEKIDLPWLNYRPTKKAARAKIKDLSKNAAIASKLFPVKLKKTIRVQVPKTTVGKADEVLVLENVTTDPRKYIKFDVFVNDEDDKPNELDRAEYAGSFAQLPHKLKTEKSTSSNITFNLKELYEDIDIGEDDTIVVTIVPQEGGEDVTIGGIKIAPPPPKAV